MTGSRRRRASYVCRDDPRRDRLRPDGHRAGVALDGHRRHSTEAPLYQQRSNYPTNRKHPTGIYDAFWSPTAAASRDPPTPQGRSGRDGHRTHALPRAVVVEDAVFDRNDLSHKISLFDLHHKYADVMTLPELASYLS